MDIALHNSSKILAYIVAFLILRLSKMFPSTASVLSFALLLHSASAEITAAARLAPRATDPAFVGYISESGGCK